MHTEGMQVRWLRELSSTTGNTVTKGKPLILNSTLCQIVLCYLCSFVKYFPVFLAGHSLQGQQLRSCNLAHLHLLFCSSAHLCSGI